MANQTNSSTSTKISGNLIEDPLDSSPAIRALFGTVAGLSLFSNALLCIVMLRRREMLTKTYNILIFSLAVTDMMTGKIVELFSFSKTAKNILLSIDIHLIAKTLSWDFGI